MIDYREDEVNRIDGLVSMVDSVKVIYKSMK